MENGRDQAYLAIQGPYFPKTIVSQTGIFLDEPTVQAWGVWMTT